MYLRSDDFRAMFISQNIRYLRKNLGLTQAELAERLGLNRPVIGAYEEGRAEPRIQTLQMMATFFKCSIDGLVNSDLSTGERGVDAEGRSLRILSIAVQPDTQQERVTLVPVKAAAGYLAGYGDIEYVASLPSFAMPFAELRADRTYRVFQIEGESMLPILPKSYVICEYLQDWTQLKDNERYVLLTRDDGIVFKRVKSLPDERYELVSDNVDFDPYTIHRTQVLEVWKARGVMSFNLEDIQSAHVEFKQMMRAIEKVDDRVARIENKVLKEGSTNG